MMNEPPLYAMGPKYTTINCQKRGYYWGKMINSKIYEKLV
jgi:hypothetical protein